MMILSFAIPVVAFKATYFDFLPSRAIVNCFLSWGLVHIWIVACKKQLKYRKLRKHAFTIVFLSSIVLSIVLSIIVFLTNPNDISQLWNIPTGILGSIGGIVSFRVLYSSCY